jgi:hypothetical protein
MRFQSTDRSGTSIRAIQYYKTFTTHRNEGMGALVRTNGTVAHHVSFIYIYSPERLGSDDDNDNDSYWGSKSLEPNPLVFSVVSAPPCGGGIANGGATTAAFGFSKGCSARGT